MSSAHETVPTLQNELEESISRYFRTMGYRQSESIFQREKSHVGQETLTFERLADRQADVESYFLLNELDEKFKSEKAPLEYDFVFGKFSSWILGLLDIFREELFATLFPVFVHLFLDLVSKDKTIEAKSFYSKYAPLLREHYQTDLDKIANVGESRHLKENSFAMLLRTTKLNLSLSSFSLKLLLDYLVDANLMPVIKILNTFLNIAVVHEKDQVFNDFVAFTRNTPSEIKPQVNVGSKLVPPFLEQSVRERLRSELISTSQLRSPEQISSSMSHFFGKLPADPKASTMESLSRPPPLTVEVRQELEFLKSLYGRSHLSGSHIPSIYCYTLHNASGDLVTSMEVSADASFISMGSSQSFLDVWCIKGEKLRSLRLSTELASLGQIDLSKDYDSLLEPEGSVSKRLVGHCGPVYSSRFTLCNSFLLSCSQDASSRLWSMKTFSNVAVYKGHTGPVWDLDTSPHNFYYASASADKTAALWSTEYVKCLRLFAGHYSDVDCIKFHPNGSLIATGSSDRTCRVWDARSGDCVRLFGKTSQPVTAICLSPDGHYLSCGDLYGNVYAWDISSGTSFLESSVEHSAKGKMNMVSGLDFCKDSLFLNATTLEGCVCLWDFSLDNSQRSSAVASFRTKSTTILRSRFNAKNTIMIAGCFQS
jgi:transcription initiation factor TFIID subunit 5